MKTQDSTTGSLPTVFHITHWKAGSQWLHRVLRDIDLERIVSPEVFEKQFLERPIVTGSIYPTVYVTREQFHSVELPRNYRKFVIIRDLRDTLVSGYFSIRYSHAVIDKSLADWRQRLEASSVEDGLIILMNEWLPLSARVQESWVNSGESYIRYEDLLTNDSEILEDVLIKQCEIPVSPARLQEVVKANRFERISGGRTPGQEDRLAHERKGIEGDWKNYFTPTVHRAFNERYGSLTTRAGYVLGNKE